MWWDIMVNGLILLVFTWYILETTDMWRRSKENCCSDATSVNVCEWNIEFSDNSSSREFILEWVNNGATASLSLLNSWGSVVMDRYQWLSNTYAWYYLLTFTTSHTSRCKSTEQGQEEWHNYLHNRQRSLLHQSSNQWFLGENEWQYAS
jgi:hypothetical protein